MKTHYEVGLDDLNFFRSIYNSTYYNQVIYWGYRACRNLLCSTCEHAGIEEDWRSKHNITTLYSMIETKLGSVDNHSIVSQAVISLQYIYNTVNEPGEDYTDITEECWSETVRDIEVIVGYIYDYRVANGLSIDFNKVVDAELSNILCCVADGIL